jgi:hypothetical protein
MLSEGKGSRCDYGRFYSIPQDEDKSQTADRPIDRPRAQQGTTIQKQLDTDESRATYFCNRNGD